jgi:hypothetical protein
MAPALFDAADRARGGIEGEDRQGSRRLIPITTVAVGAVSFVDEFPRHAEAVASLAAAAKRIAKRGAGFHAVSYEAEVPSPQPIV